MNTLLRKKDGTFSRKNELWTPEKWDMGYMDSKGRFRVYRPDYPRAYSEGYALRAHVVWWLAHGEPHPIGTELHHKDRIKHNDHIGNLEVLTKSQHRREHQENWVYYKCAHCRKKFREHAWRARYRISKFCSQECFHAHPRSKEHKKSISDGLKQAYKEGKR